MKKKISLFDICNTAFMLIVLIITVYPLYFTVIASVSDPSAVAKGDVFLLPVGFRMNAYKTLLGYKQLWIAYGNTIFYTICGTIFNLLLTIPAAYATSKKYMPARNFVLTFFLITMYFGGGMVPTYLLIKSMGLVNTRLVMIIVSGLSVYNMIITRTYFSTSIPESLFEAAEIDGAGELRKFVTIAMPLAKPIIAVITLYYAVGHWNAYFNALIYLSDINLEPLQTVLRRILMENETALEVIMGGINVSEDILRDSAQKAYEAYAMKYAVVFIASLPLLIAYPFVQKYFVKGVMIGAVKE